MGAGRERRHYQFGSTLCWGCVEIRVTISAAYIPHARHVTFVSHLVVIPVLKEMHISFYPFYDSELTG